MKTTNLMDSIESRRKTILTANGEVELAIEGRYTNLRIFGSTKDNKIRFRLDKANQYSVPLSNDTVLYLDKPHPVITELNNRFGFDNATFDDVETILELTKDMVYRACIPW